MSRSPSPVVTVQRAAPRDRLPLPRMLELYQLDLSDLWDQNLDEHGEYGYALDRFFAEHRLATGPWQGTVQCFVA
jgi:hypothetical protein